MIRTKRRVMVSISYFDFDFGDDLIAANTFANVARATITDQCRGVELKTNYYYLSDEDIEKDKEEAEDDQTTD